MKLIRRFFAYLRKSAFRKAVFRLQRMYAYYDEVDSLVSANSGIVNLLNGMNFGVGKYFVDSFGFAVAKQGVSDLKLLNKFRKKYLPSEEMPEKASEPPQLYPPGILNALVALNEKMSNAVENSHSAVSATEEPKKDGEKVDDKAVS